MNFYRRKHRGIALASLLGLWIASLAGTVCSSAQVRSHKSSIDFNRDIRPILSENCYACHGPDSLKRKAGLRLDKEEGALGELKSGNHAIIPGDRSEEHTSELQSPCNLVCRLLLEKKNRQQF